MIGLNIRIYRRLTAILLLSLITFTNCAIANSGYREMRDISSADIVKDMGIGWNLGNTLDTENIDETAWGNPITTKSLIDEISRKGFKTLRLPVTWRFHMGSAPDYIIEESWLDNVEKIANFAFDNDMYVIINIHHDDPWLIPTYDKLEVVGDKIEKLWIQISKRFKGYGDHLIFETINEPRYEGAPKEWKGGTKEERDCVNRYHKIALDAIRSTGGNNSLRHIMISTYAASTVNSAMDDLIIPNDDKRTMVSIHSYYPYEFCLDGKRSDWGSDADKQKLDIELDRIYNKFVVKGIPVVMGEWCAYNQDNLEDRVRHAKYYSEGCLSRNICPVYWDVGVKKGSGLINRYSFEWFFPELVDAVLGL